LANIFDEKLVIVSGHGMTETKIEYLAGLKDGKPIRNNIDVKEASVSLVGQTVIVVGKGVFVVTVNGDHATYNLSYLEVFVEIKKSWKLMGPLYDSCTDH